MAGRFIQVLALLFGVGCSASGQSASPAPEGRVTVHLVRFGWHADLVLPTHVCEPLPDVAPEPFRRAERVAIGWGDARYFPRENPGLVELVRAALVPTASVVQIRAVNAPVEQLYHAYEIIALELSVENCQRVGDFIRSSFSVEDRALAPVPTDRRTTARYFLSTDRYHVLHNCNHWVAEALRAGGMPIKPFLTPTVGLLWRAVKKHASGETG